ncbi:MAG TPA: hypothetical protein VI612_02485 [Candidatus Nanoarchaeia archaeon]|nr:hypothetical protein [Candidatus Nanoarchaeia archaeon]
MILKGVKYKEKERILSYALARAKPLVEKEEFTGSAPAPFVGRYGYPNVNVGILSATQHEENAWRYDAPRYWAGQNLTIQDVVQYRTSMINSRFVSNVKQPDKLVGIAQDVAMSDKTIDIDVALTKKPNLKLTTDQWVAPMGPQAKLKQLSITSNPHIPTKVQKFYDDKDALASEALTVLYSKGVDENSLSRMLSVGVFGKQRKLVPTRWSITATDDTLAKNLLAEVKEQQLWEYRAYFGSYMGNYYLLLFFPQPWSYELFELYAKPGPVMEYSTDYESFEGRKEYAENCAGGYYTVRLAIAEHLRNKKRQSSVLAIRFITDEYVLPLGVWVTREATRKALEKPITFASKELMLNYAQQIAKKKFGIDIKQILQKSNLLKQKKLNEFI